MSTTSRKICVVTGTRAEYGLLRWVMQGIQDSDVLDLQLIVTGMHLSPEFGLTVQEIEADGFRIATRKISVTDVGQIAEKMFKTGCLGASVWTRDQAVRHSLRPCASSLLHLLRCKTSKMHLGYSENGRIE